MGIIIVVVEDTIALFDSGPSLALVTTLHIREAQITEPSRQVDLGILLYLLLTQSIMLPAPPACGRPDHSPLWCTAPCCSLIHQPLLGHPAPSFLCRVNRPGNEAPLCPACLSCVPWCSGAQLGQEPETVSNLIAHYSHYLASNQRKTGCWDRSVHNS